MKIINTRLFGSLLCFLITGYLSVCGQGVNFNVYSAYVFDDKFDFYYNASEYYKGKIKGGS